MEYYDPISTIISKDNYALTFLVPSNRSIHEANSVRSEHLRMNILDVERLVKVNELKPITNPITFTKNNIPTSDGILSNEIFGISMYDRMNTCAYIDLGDWFFNPIVYKVLTTLDKNIAACVYETKYFIIDDNGVLKEDDNGETGIKFLKKNFNRLNIARTASRKRDMNVDFINKCKNDPGTFMRKQLVIPAALRDVDTSKKGRVSLGIINELYRNLILAARALRESSDYGLDMSGATRGRIQDLIVKIFDYFGNGTTINGEETGALVPGKLGVLRRAVMSKTTDYASRSVISAPNLIVEKQSDLESSLDYSAIPLAHVISGFTPYIIFAARRYFENMFSGGKGIQSSIEKQGQPMKYPKDYQMQFSEARILKEINRFCEGYSNRFVPIEVETTDGDKVPLIFIGYNTTYEEYTKNAGNMPVLDRYFTWCDLFYICATEVVADKHILINRYPIDSIYNQFATKIHVSSTIKTEPMVVNGVFYKNYPYIRQGDMGTNTSNYFVDSVRICNLYLGGLNGDYDGDTVTEKGIYSYEANEELEEIMNKKFNYINLGGTPIRTAGNEAFQSLYNLTLCLPEDEGKMEVPTFGKA